MIPTAKILKLIENDRKSIEVDRKSTRTLAKTIAIVEDCMCFSKGGAKKNTKPFGVGHNDTLVDVSDIFYFFLLGEAEGGV